MYKIYNFWIRFRSGNDEKGLISVLKISMAFTGNVTEKVTELKKEENSWR